MPYLEKPCGAGFAADVHALAARLAAFPAKLAAALPIARAPTEMLRWKQAEIIRPMRLFFLSVLLTLANGLGLPALAAEEEPIRLAIRQFLDRQTKGFAEPARYEIGKVAAGGLAAGCRRITVSPPSGNRLWGRIHLQVRCAEGANWSLFVPVEIHVIADYIVAARPVRPGQTLATADIAVRRGDLAELPPNVLTDASQAIGQNAIAALNAEQPLRADHLRKPVVVHQGQSTRVISIGSSFQVAGEGKAMGNAVAGQVVQVRMSSGQTISGIAQADGSVRVVQ